MRVTTTKGSSRRSIICASGSPPLEKPLALLLLECNFRLGKLPFHLHLALRPLFHKFGVPNPLFHFLVHMLKSFLVPPVVGLMQLALSLQDELVPLAFPLSFFLFELILHFGKLLAISFDRFLHLLLLRLEDLAILRYSFLQLLFVGSVCCRNVFSKLLLLLLLLVVQLLQLFIRAFQLLCLCCLF